MSKPKFNVTYILKYWVGSDTSHVDNHFGSLNGAVEELKDQFSHGEASIVTVGPLEISPCVLQEAFHRIYLDDVFFTKVWVRYIPVSLNSLDGVEIAEYSGCEEIKPGIYAEPEKHSKVSAQPGEIYDTTFHEYEERF